MIDFSCEFIYFWYHSKDQDKQAYQVSTVKFVKGKNI